MKEKIKTGISVLLILILLPYVAAVLRTGKMGGEEKPSQEQDLETLVAEILPAQMPVHYEMEALKAQAVVIRTNLLRQAMNYYESGSPGEAAQALREEELEQLGFSFYSREDELRVWGYGDWELHSVKCDQAAKETAGQVLVLGESGGLPADVPYHAVSSGRTREGSVLGGEYSWLVPADCPEDLHSSDYLKIQTLKLDAVPTILSKDAEGYATEVRLGEEVMSGEKFRSLYGLNSSNFAAEETEEGVRFTTKGLGHGLGMSMYQANAMALEGRKYQEILQYFYKNLECISFS